MSTVSPLRLPWSRSDRAFPRTVVRPLQEFLRSSTASALPLFCAAVVALAWANSPWWRSYERLWATTLTVGVGRWAINEDLRFWVGEGLMTFFFLLAGLEIKRELVTGELRDRRAAIGAGGGCGRRDGGTGGDLPRRDERDTGRRRLGDGDADRSGLRARDRGDRDALGAAGDPAVPPHARDRRRSPHGRRRGGVLRGERLLAPAGARVAVGRGDDRLRTRARPPSPRVPGARRADVAVRLSRGRTPGSGRRGVRAARSGACRSSVRPTSARPLTGSPTRRPITPTRRTRTPRAGWSWRDCRTRRCRRSRGSSTSCCRG